MIVCFLHNDHPRERLLAEAVVLGAHALGDKAFAVPKSQVVIEGLPDADVYGMVGVKSKETFSEVLRRGAHALNFDKGYSRHIAPTGPRVWEYWRVSLDAQHPTEAVMRLDRSPDRFQQINWQVAPWRTHGAHVLLAGSSAKYHDFHGLSEPTTYWRKVARQVAKLTQRPIVYRPKPSWRDAVEIKGTTFSGPTQHFGDALAGAWCVVTHGSNAAVDSIMAGVPVISLGDGAAAPICSRSVESINDPYLAPDDERQRWFNALAYCQWTHKEIAAGVMWADIKRQIF